MHISIIQLQIECCEHGIIAKIYIQGKSLAAPKPPPKVLLIN